MTTSTLTIFNPQINNGLIMNQSSLMIANISDTDKLVWSQLTGIFIHNTDTNNSLDITIQSQADSYGKSKTINLNNINAGDYAVINFLDCDFPINGLVSITYNQFAGASTSAYIMPVNFSKP